MIRKMGKRLRIVIATILSFLMLTIPISGGLAAAQLAQNNSPLKYVQLHGAERESLVRQAINSTEVKSVLTAMAVGKLNVSNGLAVRWNYDNKQGDVVILKAKDPKEIQIVYANTNGTIKAGAGMFTVIDGNRTVNVFDVVKSEVYQTSTVKWVDKQAKITWKNGPLAANNKKKTDTTITPDSSTSCNICNYVGDVIYGSGCSLTGFFLCSSACAPFGGITCPIICGIVYGIMCTTGDHINIPSMCQDLGYCP